MITFIIFILVIIHQVRTTIDPSGFSEMDEYNDYDVICSSEGSFSRPQNDSYILCTKTGPNTYKHEIKKCWKPSTFNLVKRKCIRKISYSTIPEDPTNNEDYEIECGVTGNFPGPTPFTYVSCVQTDTGLLTSLLKKCTEKSVFDKDARKCIRKILPEEDNTLKKYKCTNAGNFPGDNLYQYISCTKAGSGKFIAQLKHCRGKSYFHRTRGRCIRILKSHEQYDIRFDFFTCKEQGNFSGPVSNTYIHCKLCFDGLWEMNLVFCPDGSFYENYLKICVFSGATEVIRARADYSPDYPVGRLCFWNGWYCSDCFTRAYCNQVLLKNTYYRNQIVDYKRCDRDQICSNFHFDCIDNAFEVPTCINKYIFYCTSTGFFPHPYDCTKFYLCHEKNGHGELVGCRQKNHYFDVIDAQCHRYKNNQKPDACPPTVPCNTPNQLYALMRNRTYYYKCIAFNYIADAYNVLFYKCPYNLIFHKGQCVHSSYELDKEGNLKVVPAPYFYLSPRNVPRYRRRTTRPTTERVNQSTTPPSST